MKGMSIGTEAITEFAETVPVGIPLPTYYH